MNFIDQEQFLREAYFQAKHSPDRSNQNGTILLGTNIDSEYKLYGYNNFPPGVKITEERLTERPTKYLYTEHAERDVIFNAAADGYATRGQSLICPWSACADCARAIICSRLRILVVHKQRQEQTPERWQPSIDVALNMIKEAGVRIIEYDGPIPSCSILVNGRMWNPATFEYEDGENTSNITMDGDLIV